MKPFFLVCFAAAALAQPVDVKTRRQGDSTLRLDPSRTAIIVCDMWDKHWCRGATERVGELVTRMNPVLDAARSHGILIIHAPSETMDFYKDAPQRLSMLRLPKANPSPVLDVKDAPLPIDDKDGGCDTEGDSFYKAWKREHPGLTVAPNDLISDNGLEVYSALKQRGIDNLLVMGVHTNMCILNRTFAIKQMTRWGVKCTLVRDLTDAMYDPKDAPHVSHAKGTALVVDYIERYWCPTMLSSDLVAALPAR